VIDTSGATVEEHVATLRQALTVPLPANLQVRIRRACVGDVPALAAFGARSFEETFGETNAPEDMAAYLAATYGERQQHAEVTDPDIVTLLVEADTALAGFAQVRRGGQAPACVTGASTVELWRFYVDRRWHGRGLAQQLMAQVRRAARELGGRRLWLSVWERNPRAIAFYTKCGFIDAGAKSFYVGSDCQTDRVLIAPVAETSFEA
jgi:diamine N-acetyltransferase